MTIDQKPGRLVTIVDIAREAGVGESTVSRVLRGRGSFSKRAGERVLEVATRLGYVPNRLAGSLAGNSSSVNSGLVGIIIPSLANIVFPDLLRGLTSTLEITGFQNVIGISDYDPEREEALVSSLLSWRPAALVLTGLEHTPVTVARLRAAGIRVMEIFDTDGPGLDMVVGFSHRAVGHASARHLIGRGYRRIGYVGHDLGRDLRAAKRLAGFEAALNEAGLALHARELGSGPSSAAAGRAALDALVARVPDVDAVYFSNDDMALGGYFCCLGHGWAVPGRVALFGCHALDITEAMPQPLSTMRTPRFEIGQTCAQRLAAGVGPGTLDLGFELSEGTTA